MGTTPRPGRAGPAPAPRSLLAEQPDVDVSKARLLCVSGCDFGAELRQAARLGGHRRPGAPLPRRVGSAAEEGGGRMRARAWWRHGLPAAVSVVFGAGVAVLAALATSADATVAVVAGLAALVLAWAGWEATRAVYAARSASVRAGQPSTTVRFRFGRVADDTSVVGMRGEPVGETTVKIRARELTGSSEVVGVDQGRSLEQLPDDPGSSH